MSVNIENSTKIVATLGPSSNTYEAIKKLVLAGADVFRLNLSHGSHDGHKQVIKEIRRIGSEFQRAIGILADLQGPKIRLGPIEGKTVLLENGQIFKLVTSQVQEIGNSKVLTTGTKHADLCIQHITVGENILINDGTVTVKVIERKGPNEIVCQVTVGGEVSERQGLNLPHLALKINAITEKDEKDAIFALQQDVDFVALSFVQHAADVIALRKLLTSNTKGTSIPKIISKIEKPSAIENIDSIIEVSDGIMIARGDLSVECSFEKVPSYQKMIIRKCQTARIPTITATQMLHSMIQSPTPTRAEVSDVANAVHDGSDAVMLSGESASGKFPVDSVEVMAKIIQEAERMKKEFGYSWNYEILRAEREQKVTAKREEKSYSQEEYDHAIAVSAVTAALTEKCAALIVICNSYELGTFFAKLRPPCPVIIITFHSHLANALSLSYGCYCIVMPQPTSQITSDSFILSIEQKIAERKWLSEGDLTVFCSCGSSSPLAHLPLLRHTLQLTRFGHHGKHPKISAKL